MPRKGEGIKQAISAVTRASRIIGRRAANLYDFHALRTTFVTQAFLSLCRLIECVSLSSDTSVDSGY